MEYNKNSNKTKWEIELNRPMIKNCRPISRIETVGFSRTNCCFIDYWTKSLQLSTTLQKFYCVRAVYISANSQELSEWSVKLCSTTGCV